MVPHSTIAQKVQLTLLTIDNYVIDNQKIYFNFVDDNTITSIEPNRGDMKGGYTFTLKGDFSELMSTPDLQLFWETGVEITLTSKSITELKGLVPESTREFKQVYPYIYHNRVPY